MKRSLIIIPLLLITVLYLFGGCSKEIKGPDRTNVPPEVRFVNIPSERARFSADATIYWYGTDIDGFISMYRYAVVESTIVGDPSSFIASTGTDLVMDDSLIDWVNINVTLENTGTNDQVRMSADVNDPVRKYISSYVFLQAIDDQGAKSQIIYREFLKNNHFPNTFINANPIGEPYVNAEAPGGILEGVSIGFSSEDPIDYSIGEEPDFEYRWKLFGPFTDSVLNLIETTYIDSIFMDNNGDLYRVGETLHVYLGLDTTIDSSSTPYDTTIDSSFNQIAVSNVIGANQYGSWYYSLLGVEPALDSAILPEADHSMIPGMTLMTDNVVDSSNGYSYASDVNVYDIFRYQEVTPESDTTRLMNFVVWAQCRDDANTPDKIPAYEYISAIEPRYEREVIVLDAGRYSSTSQQNYAVNPARFPYRGNPEFADSFMVRNVYGEYVNNWKTNSFDAVNVLPRGSRDGEIMYYDIFGATEDYYSFSLLHRNEAPGVTLREILKHKIMILIKDETRGVIGLTSDEGSFILEALNSGLSCWVMARAGADAGFIEDGAVPDISPEYADYFGVDSLQTDDWQRRTATGILSFSPRFEDFIGVSDISTDSISLPDMLIDTVLLEHRYFWDYLGYPFNYYPFRAPLVLDTVLTIYDTVATTPVVIVDTTYSIVPDTGSHTGQQVAGGPDSGYAAMPEVGFIFRASNSTSLYLYRSIYPEYGLNYYNQVREGNTGSVVAVRLSTPVFRTAYFGFTLLAFDPVTGQEMFNEMMDWLSDQPYITTGKMRPVNYGPFNSFDVQKYRDHSERLRQMRIEGLLHMETEY